MHDRFPRLFASGTFGALLLTSSALAATPASAPYGTADKRAVVKATPARKAALKAPAAVGAARRTSTPIAGILDGSNGETINVHGHHAADGTAAKYMNKVVYLGPLGNRDTLDTPYSVMGVTHDVVVNQQIRSINDMAQYLPPCSLKCAGTLTPPARSPAGLNPMLWPTPVSTV